MHQLVSAVAQYTIVLSVVGVAGLWLSLGVAQKKRFIVEAALAALLAYGIAKLGAALYYDTRPFIVGHFTPYFGHSTDNGFPSDHTLLASYAGFLAYRYNRTVGVALLVLAALIGAARVVAGVHHTVDIVGAFAASLLGVFIATAVYGYVARRRQA